ncbi:hypothetical protein CVU37_05960 [candidate division BRC1 bacterium HGW-BRC1-1]|nr:MAG: hypothetical protein CVU37_05960 [candidate division BRC1 bacterium HGW-BRC1-1]
MNVKRAFTLIELLIVVAIIAILAAIAVPNFLEAQVRSKVARVKADLRTYATAIESYAVDYNKPPREANVGVYGNIDQVYNQSTGSMENVAGILSTVLSTPISYLTNARDKDVFQDKNLIAALDEQFYTYQDMLMRSTGPSSNNIYGSAFYVAAFPFYGNWRMMSVGPDRRFGHPGTVPTAQLAYDSTNGTISMGNITRCQVYSDNVQPAPGKGYGPAGTTILLGAP